MRCWSTMYFPSQGYTQLASIKTTWETSRCGSCTDQKCRHTTIQETRSWSLSGPQHFFGWWNQVYRLLFLYGRTLRWCTWGRILPETKHFSLNKRESLEGPWLLQNDSCRMQSNCYELMGAANKRLIYIQLQEMIKTVITLLSFITLSGVAIIGGKCWQSTQFTWVWVQLYITFDAINSDSVCDDTV